ncbi:metallophosphoesterase family protein [Caminibacter pacificus]
MSDIKIIADTHFGHSNILLHEPSRMQKARMEGYENFERFLIDRLNEYISKEDEVLHLGDVAFKDAYKTAFKLNGKITLIKGNHDKQKHLEYYKSIGWKVIEDIEIHIDFDKEILNYLQYKYDKKTLSRTSCLIKKIGSKTVLFSHYPVFNDNPYDEKYKNISKLLEEIFYLCGCDLNVHGHTHSYMVNDKRCINACLEVNNFKPLILKEKEV